MSQLPIRPRLKTYRAAKENLRRRTAEYNAMAMRVTDHLNREIANDPGEIQQYSFALLAIDLRLTTDQVRSAISNGGYNGITVGVTPQDREAMARYKS